MIDIDIEDLTIEGIIMFDKTMMKDVEDDLDPTKDTQENIVRIIDTTTTTTIDMITHQVKTL
eukprot:CAMPEP_0116872468 /NCGR_PEP_ID=MMETSP0463-20121206/3226_1 /TAXON_ID=181622 /ORGANISM="Strombidinopsis sp, Strain SopsisLIS2011" /LENGTH=61 /DNA_ID=CAMNT_0004512735 /DNA_START=1207 /DNA_END=1389 /DNA_ORIENTATION=+